MSLDLVGALAQIFTGLVIAATAIAALVQLRHMRGSNQIATMARFETLDASPEVEASKRFIIQELKGRMKDAAFRQSLGGNSLSGDARLLLPVFNMYEQMGNYVRHGYIDKDFVLDNYSGQIASYWNDLSPVIPYLRAAQGPSVGVWFEYLAALTQEYFAQRRDTNYPSTMPRMPLDTALFDADRRSAGDRAP